MINVQVERNNNENNLSVLKKFTKRVQSSGILPRVRSLRYSQRNQSRYNTKKRTLKSLRRKEEVEQLIKLGKMSDNKR